MEILLCKRMSSLIPIDDASKEALGIVATYGSERELLERIDKVLGKRRAA